MNDEEKKVLGKKRKIDSKGKEVYLIEFDEEGKEIIKSQRKIESKEDFSEYLSSLQNPFYFKDGKLVDLTVQKEQNIFFSNKSYERIYEKKSDLDLLNEYKLVFQDVIEKKKIYKIDYPITLDRLCLSPKFYFNLPDTNWPKFYGIDDSKQMGLSLFFSVNEFQIFHLFARKESGTSLLIMKLIHRKKEYYVYFDIRKLKEILSINNNENNNKIGLLRRFIYYSLFYIHGFYYDINYGYKRVENYYYYIWEKVFIAYASQNKKDFIVSLLNAYVSLYKDYILEFLNLEKKEEYQTMIIILDHYTNEIEIEYINNICKDNPKLRFLIVHSIKNKKEIEEFFSYLDDDTFEFYSDSSSTHGIEVYKNNTMIGYYREMIELSENIFNDKDIPVISLYKKELLENFGLINQSFYFKFLDYMIDKNNDEEDLIIFKKFIKSITLKVEYDINNFYNNISDENFFISKYYKEFLQDIKIHEDNQEEINLIKKNIPLDYFMIEYSGKNKNITNIIPCCELIRNIIIKKSKYFDTVIYQSKYFDNTNNNADKGNILQRAIEERIQIEPSILLNYFENTLIFKLRNIIPSSKNIGHKKYDPVEKYFEEIIKQTREPKEVKDISSYMSADEIEDMETLKNILSSSQKDFYNNIILIQSVPNAKNYDLGIIKFIDKNYYVLILLQITVSREKSKFVGINSLLEKDICYITAKIEYFLPKYKSKGVNLIYILDKKNEYIIPEVNNSNNKEIKFQTNNILTNNSNQMIDSKLDKDIPYKSNLSQNLKSQVYLLYFGRKFLNFYDCEGKMIKELFFENDQLKFNVSMSQHYFSQEYLQKIFDEIVKVFSISIGKFYIDDYDFSNKAGNFLILTKISSNYITIVINIYERIMHFLEAKDNIIRQINYVNIDEEKKSYFFEITNPENINSISLFGEIKI